MEQKTEHGKLLRWWESELPLTPYSVLSQLWPKGRTNQGTVLGCKQQNFGGILSFLPED